MLVLLHHARLVLPSSSFSLLPLSSLGDDCLSSLLPGGPGPPSRPSPKLTPFPSGPRQCPAFVSGMYKLYIFPSNLRLLLEIIQTKLNVVHIWHTKIANFVVLVLLLYVYIHMNNTHTSVNSYSHDFALHSTCCTTLNLICFFSIKTCIELFTGELHEIGLSAWKMNSSTAEQ